MGRAPAAACKSCRELCWLHVLILHFHLRSALHLTCAPLPQDFTAVFAAGNEGFHVSAADDGLKTVTSPATSKNGIAAGATNTAWQLSGSAASSRAYVVLRMAISQALAGGSQMVDKYRVRALPAVHCNCRLFGPLCCMGCTAVTSGTALLRHILL